MALQELEGVINTLRESGIAETVLVLPQDAACYVVDTGWIDRLAKRVHDAWMAEKQRQGFADHPLSWKCGFVRMNDKPLRLDCRWPLDKHSYEMVPYDQLGEAIKEYYRATVRAVLHALIAEGDGK